MESSGRPKEVLVGRRSAWRACCRDSTRPRDRPRILPHRYLTLRAQHGAPRHVVPVHPRVHPRRDRDAILPVRVHEHARRPRVAVLAFSRAFRPHARVPQRRERVLVARADAPDELHPDPTTRHRVVARRSDAIANDVRRRSSRRARLIRPFPARRALVGRVPDRLARARERGRASKRVVDVDGPEDAHDGESIVARVVGVGHGGRRARAGVTRARRPSIEYARVCDQISNMYYEIPMYGPKYVIRLLRPPKSSI